MTPWIFADLGEIITIYINAQYLWQNQMKCCLWNIFLMLFPNFSIPLQINCKDIFKGYFPLSAHLLSKYIHQTQPS